MVAGARNVPICRSGEGQNRTGDTTIFSRVLYQLSYLARNAMVAAGRALYADRHGRRHVGDV